MVVAGDESLSLIGPFSSHAFGGISRSHTVCKPYRPVSRGEYPPLPRSVVERGVVEIDGWCGRVG
jgi:hypothetical protein